MNKDETKGRNVEASEASQLDSSGNTDPEERTADNPSILEGKIDEDTEDKQSDCMDDQNSEQSFWSDSGSDSEPDCIEKLDGSYLI